MATFTCLMGCGNNVFVRDTACRKCSRYGYYKCLNDSCKNHVRCDGWYCPPCSKLEELTGPCIACDITVTTYLDKHGWRVHKCHDCFVNKRNRVTASKIVLDDGRDKAYESHVKAAEQKERLKSIKEMNHSETSEMLCKSLETVETLEKRIIDLEEQMLLCIKLINR
jgi:hypothetical protein